MGKSLIGVVGSLVALVAFAGTAGASATIDLLWNGTTSVLVDETGNASSSTLTLDILLTAGPNGVSGYTFTVLYDPTKVQVTGFSQTSFPEGNQHFGSAPGEDPTDNGTSLSSFNGLAVPPFGLGTGLNEGNTVSLGTIQFHKLAGPGTFSVDAALVVPLDDFADQAGNSISNPTFNAAFLVNIPEPGTVALLGLGLGGLALAGRRRS